jgi:HrpA-like RNA helicase
MSATIEPKIFMNYYKEFGIKYIEGYAKPPKKIEEDFLKKSIYKLDKNGEIMGTNYIEKAVEIITEKILFPKKEGDILVILPGKSDCQKCCVALDGALAEKRKKDLDFQEKPFCVVLTAKSGGTKDKGTIRYALNSSYKEINNSYTRRIIMATEVAESGLTIDGDNLIWIIDSGLSNKSIYYPEENIEALEKRFISKASHTQRKGRVGRKVDGHCYNLFTEDEYKKFQDYTTPPILVEDLADNILSLFKSVSHVNLPFSYKKKDKDSLNLFLHNMITPPNPKYVSSAISRYFLIKAINVEKNKGYLSPLGRELTRFGGKKNISPFNAACAIEGFNLRVGREVADVIALLEVLENKIERLFNKPKDKNKMKDYDKKVSSFVSSYGEHVTLFHIMKKYRQKKYNLTYERGVPKYTSKETEEASKWAKDNYINAKKLKNAVDVAKDINRNIGLIIRRTPRTGDVKKFKKSYKTCFPEVKTIGDIDRFSLFNYVKVKPSIGIYSNYIKIGGRKRFTIFSKVPTKIINDFKDREKDILKMC